MSTIDTICDQKTVMLLVVEDPPARAFLTDNFTIDGFEVVACDEATSAKHLVAEQRPDVALVDVNAGSGLRFAEAVREDRLSGVSAALPMILLGSDGGELETLRSLDAGADDFVAKPFSYPVLRARIEALLRRCHRKQDERRPVRVGELAIDLPKRLVEVAGRPVKLTRREFELVTRLASDPTRVFTKHELLTQIWGYVEHADTRTLDSHACRLRLKLEGAGQPLVINVWGVGYRLTDPTLSTP